MIFISYLIIHKELPDASCDLILPQALNEKEKIIIKPPII